MEEGDQVYCHYHFQYVVWVPVGVEILFDVSLALP